MSRSWRAGAGLLAVVAGLLLGWVVTPAQAAGGAGADPHTLDYRLKPRQIARDTWVIEGAVEDFSPANGCNIINTGFIATADGVIVINTGPSRLYGQQQRAAIEGITRAPVLRVINLNLHPDYFFGNQAWADRPLQALPGSITGMQAEGGAYANNLYRLCGDWMKGTESMPASQPLQPQSIELGGHRLEWRRLSGHTGDDLVLIDHSTGVVFAGGLVFVDRVPTTPHADIERWQASLTELERLLPEAKVWVPSHGPVRTDAAGIAQTRDWLRWLDSTLKTSADKGLDIGEVLGTPVPARFARWAAQPAEFQRSVTQHYPAYERRALGAVSPAQ